jgi:hypothetical protein
MNTHQPHKGFVFVEGRQACTCEFTERSPLSAVVRVTDRAKLPERFVLFVPTLDTVFRDCRVVLRTGEGTEIHLGALRQNCTHRLA